VALVDTIRNLAHAVLVVYMDDDAYVLDNLTTLVLSHTRYQHYAPQYSVNEVYRWAHVRPKKK
jgi:predicted transglutaminase-like cysteine proteinase